METKRLNQNAIKSFMELAKQTNAEKLFNDNYTAIKYTIVGYEFLKHIYNEHRIPFEKDWSFQMIFSQFYVLRWWFCKEFTANFYPQMDKIRNSSNKMSPKKVAILAKTLSTNEKEGFQFSFVTKMMNLSNDDTYPIYDKEVAFVFGFNTKDLEKKSFDDKANIYANWYQEITDTYNELIAILNKQTSSLLNKFRAYFDCNLSDMRIMDIIFWQLGKELKKAKQNK